MVGFMGALLKFCQFEKLDKQTLLLFGVETDIQGSKQKKQILVPMFVSLDEDHIFEF